MRTLAPYKFLTALVLASASLFYAAASAVGQAVSSAAPENAGSASQSPIVAPLKWKSSGVLIEPVSDDTHEIVSVKDPDRGLLQRHVAHLRDDRQHPRQLEHGVLDASRIGRKPPKPSRTTSIKTRACGDTTVHPKCSISGRTRSGT